MRPIDRPALAKKMGNRPQARPGKGLIEPAGCQGVNAGHGLARTAYAFTKGDLYDPRTLDQVNGRRGDANFGDQIVCCVKDGLETGVDLLVELPAHSSTACWATSAKRP